MKWNQLTEAEFVHLVDGRCCVSSAILENLGTHFLCGSGVGGHQVRDECQNTCGLNNDQVNFAR